MCLGTISRGPRGVLRRSEPLEGIYDRFPSVDPVAVRARVPYLGKVYIEQQNIMMHRTANENAACLRRICKRSDQPKIERLVNNDARLILR